MPNINTISRRFGHDDDMIIEPMTMNPNMATKLTRRVQKISHSIKYTGRYFPLHSLRDKVIAASIVRAIKANKIKKIAVSFDSSVE